MYNSFTHVLTSNERLNSDDIYPTYYDFTFGGFKNPSDKYQIDVVQMIMDYNIPVLTAEGLLYASINLTSDNSIFPIDRGVLIPLSIDGYKNGYTAPYNHAFTFNCSNLRSQRVIRISILDLELNAVQSNNNYNKSPINPFNEAETTFAMILKITPIS